MRQHERRVSVARDGGEAVAEIEPVGLAEPEMRRDDGCCPVVEVDPAGDERELQVRLLERFNCCEFVVEGEAGQILDSSGDGLAR